MTYFGGFGGRPLFGGSPVGMKLQNDQTGEALLFEPDRSNPSWLNDD